MAKVKRRVIWASKAISDRKNILEYWNLRNKSTSYSRKLDFMFEFKTKGLLDLYHSGFHNMGHATSFEDVRYLIIRDYKVYFRFYEGNIFILRIWDGRRDPDYDPFS